jgi:Flp pilus assembly pilin Flp
MIERFWLAHWRAVLIELALLVAFICGAMVGQAVTPRGA